MPNGAGSETNQWICMVETRTMNDEVKRDAKAVLERIVHLRDSL
ncbi:MAG: hypothetical protein NVSMB14_11850 [Isosphaeraceae bacterium]